MHHLFGDHFDAALRDDGQRLAMTLGGAQLSYAALADAARDLAARLRAALPGAAGGTPVALMCPCPMTNLLAFLAAQHAGFAHVPVNPKLTEPELARLLALTGTRLLLSEAPRGLPEGIVQAAVTPARPGALPVFHLAPAATGPDGTDGWPAPDGAATGLVIASSGSSGRPKCVRIPRARYAAHIAEQAQACDIRAEDVFQLVLPLFHGGGLIGVLGIAMASGASIAAMPPAPFQAEPVLDHLEASGATLAHWIPTMLFRVAEALENRPRALSRLRRVHFGSMPMDPALFERCRALFPGKLLQIYASTECGFIGTLPPEAIDAGTTASAYIPPGRGVRIVDTAGHEVAVGETGELVVEAARALFGDYADEPSLSARTRRGGFVHSGDLVERLPGGAFRLVSRLNSMIVSGGFKVIPSDVESVLARHPGIREVAVVGVPDPEFGEAVCAVVVGEEAPALEALRGWARDHLAPYKLPRRVIRLAALPRTDTGKPAYGALRALAAQSAPAS